MRHRKQIAALGRTQTCQQWADELGVSPVMVKTCAKQMGHERAIAWLLQRRESHKARANIPAGHPGSLSWESLSWDDDAHAQYVVEMHPKGLSQAAVGQLIGVSENRIAQIEKEALRQLEKLPEVRQWRGHKTGALATAMELLEMEAGE